MFMVLIIKCINIKNNKVKPFVSLSYLCLFVVLILWGKKVETEKANTRIWFVSVQAASAVTYLLLVNASLNTN